MAATATAPSVTPHAPHALTEKLNRKPGRVGMLAFGVVLTSGSSLSAIVFRATWQGWSLARRCPTFSWAQLY